VTEQVQNVGRARRSIGATVQVECRAFGPQSYPYREPPPLWAGLVLPVFRPSQLLTALRADPVVTHGEARRAGRKVGGREAGQKARIERGAPKARHKPCAGPSDVQPIVSANHALTGVATLCRLFEPLPSFFTAFLAGIKTNARR
jgi:hypothetical protein